MPSPLVLASSSPYRKELLERLHLQFSVDPTAIDEAPLPGESPYNLSLRLSKMKAQACAERHPGAVVIGSDQVLDLEGECLGKPGNRENAIAQLLKSSGKTLIFQTAVSVVDSQGVVQSAVVPTTIKMRLLTQLAVEAYVDLEKPFNCAGAAKIEKMGIALVRDFSSPDPTAIIGLPLITLIDMLKNAGINVLPGI